ncbi:LppM family (lipo)protein [Luteimicrobium subarcticum]|uniref:Uncharacterized protein DUF3153 n=1 Tax=Luteimicrobium subarcticum TaxID=620910 RepID=A0A2M8WS29_9MICO|nr:DUF3153 domain-containing protein [Luteimicrobium subarcticum]PJI93747.1 uncharacterized protein DUF3153 [Luteimicrobium subarcticum]
MSTTTTSRTGDAPAVPPSERPRGRRRRAAALTTLAAVTVLALSGCVKIDMAFTLHSDNTADGTVIYAIQDSAAKALGQDPKDLLKEATEGEDPADDFGEGATSEPYQQDGYTGTKVTLKNSSLDDLGGDATSTSGTEDPDDLKIVRDGDEFVVSGKLDLADLGSDADAEESGLSSDQIASLFDVKIAITFPGAVVSADPAATIDGSTVTWTSSGSDVINLDARGKATTGSSGLAWWVWLLIGLAVLAVIAVVLLVLLRGRKPAAQDAPDAHPQDHATQRLDVQPGFQADAPPAPTPPTDVPSTDVPSTDLPPTGLPPTDDGAAPPWEAGPKPPPAPPSAG